MHDTGTIMATANTNVNVIQDEVVVLANIPLRLLVRFSGKAVSADAFSYDKNPGNLLLHVDRVTKASPSRDAFNIVEQWMRAADRAGSGLHRLPLLQARLPATDANFLNKAVDIYSAALALDVNPEPKFLRQRIVEWTSTRILSAGNMQYIWDRVGLQDDAIVVRRMVTAYHDRASQRTTPFFGEDDAIIDLCSSTPGLDELFYEIGAVKADWALLEARGKAVRRGWKSDDPE